MIPFKQKTLFRNAVSKVAPWWSLRAKNRKPSFFSSAVAIEHLESKFLLTVNPAFDLIDLDALRNDPEFSEIDGANPARDLRVAVLDTGISGSHTQLVGNFVGYVDFVQDEFSGGVRTVHTNPALSEDPNGHGTHVSGTIGSTNPDIGVAPGAELIGLRVLGDGANGGEISEALQWVIDNRSTYGIVAVNMSLGVPSAFFNSPDAVDNNPTFRNWQRLLQQLDAAGITVVTAAGNNYGANALPGQGDPALRENLSTPAISSQLAVGAVWQDGSVANARWGSGTIDNSTGADRLTSFSQRLSTYEGMLFAPGAVIESTLPGNRIGGSSGTSMAAPVVTGAVVLLQDAALQFGSRLLTPSEVRQILISTADTIRDGDDEDDNVINGNNTEYRRMNIYRAVQEVQRRLDDGPPDNPPPPPTVDEDQNATLSTATIIETDLAALTSLTPVVNTASIGSDAGSAASLPADVDLYSIVVPGSGGLLTIQTELPQGSSLPMDTMLRLFDANGAELALDDDGGSNLYSFIETNLSSGTYYIGVTAFPNSSYNPLVAGSGTTGGSGDYSLLLQFEGNSRGATGDQNGTLSTAVNLGDLSQFAATAGFDVGIVIGTDPISDLSDRGNVGDADVDMLQFDVSSLGSYIFETNGFVLPPEAGENFNPFDSDGDGVYDDFVDTVLRLFDSNGQELALDDDGGEGLYSRIEIDLQPGTYYLAVSGYNNSSYDPNVIGDDRRSGSTGVATLSVVVPQSDGQQDPNGTRRGAVPVSLTFGGITEFFGEIGNDNGAVVNTLADVDLYEFRATASGTLLIDTDTPFGSEFGNEINWVDTYLRVFDGNGNEIVRADDVLASDFTGNLIEFPNAIDSSLTEDAAGNLVGHFLDSFARVDVTAGETYFIGISAFGNSEYNLDNLDDRSTNAGTGAYQLIIAYGGDTAGTDEDGSISPSLELIDLTSTSSSSVIQRPGIIGQDSVAVGNRDVDFYRIHFSGSESRILTIDIDARSLPTASNLDSTVTLFDASGERLAFNDDEGGSLDSLVQHTLMPNINYYVAVTGFGNSDFDPFVVGSGSGGSEGEYVLKLNLSTPSTGGGSGRERLPGFLSAGAQQAPDLDLNIVSLDLTATDVFAENQLTVFEVGQAPLFLTGTLGQDVDDASTGSGTAERPALRNAFGPVYLSATGSSGNVNVVNIGPADVDIYPIRITTPGFYDIRTLNTGDDIGQLSANVSLRLYSASGTEIVISEQDAPRAGVDSEVVVDLPAGDYFLVVLPEGSGNSRFNFSSQTFSGVTEQELAEFALSTGGYDLTISQHSLRVTTIEQNGSVFQTTLSHSIDPGKLALYDNLDSVVPGAPSLRLLSSNGTSISGSAVFDSGNGQLVFIPTNPVLPSGNYTFELEQSDVVSELGSASLGTSTIQQIFAVTSAPTVWVPGFARGPGQSVDFGVSGAGLPLRISDGQNLTRVRLTVDYDPRSLSITAADTASGLPGDWSVQGFSSINGRAVIDLSGTTPLPEGAVDLLRLSALVPQSAIYNSANLLRVSGGGRDASGNAVTLQQATTLHKVAYFADANGDGLINFGDLGAAANIFVSSAATGFDAFDLVDPTLIGDINGDGFINFGDLLPMAQEFLSDSPLIPPSTAIPTTPGPGPRVAVSNISAEAGQSAPIVIRLPDTSDAVDGIGSFQFVVHYDTARLDITPGDITLSSDLTALGYQIVGEVSVDDAAGEIRFGALSLNGNRISHNSTPDVATLNFTVSSNAAAGTAAVTLGMEPNQTAMFDPASVMLTLTIENGSVTVGQAQGGSLSVTIQASPISEAAGANATTAVVTRTGDLSQEITVTLSSSDTSEATVPATVVIPAGQASSAAFAISAVDDTEQDGSQTVIVTATATGLTAGTGTLIVTDDEVGSGSVLDLDGSGGTGQAQSDGLLIFGILAGVTNPSQLNGLISPAGTRTPAEIVSQVDNIRSQLDVDGVGGTQAQSDGLLIFAILAGVTSETQLSGLVGPGSTRSIAEIIQNVNALQNGSASASPSVAAVLSSEPEEEDSAAGSAFTRALVSGSVPGDTWTDLRWQDALFSSSSLWDDEDEFGLFR